MLKVICLLGDKTVETQPYRKYYVVNINLSSNEYTGNVRFSVYVKEQQKDARLSGVLMQPRLHMYTK